MSKSKKTKRDLELENAELRGRVKALEEIAQAYRAMFLSRDAGPHKPVVWPSVMPAPLPEWAAPSTKHSPSCACFQCRPDLFVTYTTMHTGNTISAPRPSDLAGPHLPLVTDARSS